MKYELSDQVKNNLLIFLQRIDLKGSEVGAYIEIINCLNVQLIEEIKELKIND